MKLHHVLTLTFLLLLCLVNDIATQNPYYYEALPFDSSGVFQASYTIPLNGILLTDLEKEQKGDYAYLDSVSLEKLAHLTTLLQENERLVIRALLYDAFYLRGAYAQSGVNLTLNRAQRIVRKICGRTVDLGRMELRYYTDDISESRQDEKLLFEDIRLELLVYELPKS